VITGLKFYTVYRIKIAVPAAEVCGMWRLVISHWPS